MAIQIFRQSGPTWAESLNAGLGQLAQNYNQQKQMQQQQSRMQQALQQLGYSSQEAAALGSLPEKLQFEVMKSLAQRPYVPGGAEFADQQTQAVPVAATEQFMEQPQAPEMSTQELASAAIKRSKTPYMFGIPDQTIEMMKMLAPSMQQTQEQQAQQDAQAQSQPQPAVMQQQQPAISGMQKIGRAHV